MTTAIVIVALVLSWKICAFVMRVFLKAVCYMMFYMIVLVIYAGSFLLNVFTVPLLIIVHIAQKRRGRQLPYVGRRLLIFYPTFSNAKVTEAKREADLPVKVLVIQSDHWLDDPLF